MQQNADIKEAYDVQVRSAKEQNLAQKSQLDSISKELNLKIQECLIKEEALEETQ